MILFSPKNCAFLCVSGNEGQEDESKGLGKDYNEEFLLTSYCLPLVYNLMHTVILSVVRYPSLISIPNIELLSSFPGDLVRTTEYRLVRKEAPCGVV